MRDMGPKLETTPPSPRRDGDVPPRATLLEPAPWPELQSFWGRGGRSQPQGFTSQPELCSAGRMRSE